MSQLTKLDITQINKQILAIQRASEGTDITPPSDGNGVALLKNFSKGATNSGTPKFTGTLANIDEVRFNVWNNSRAFEFFEALPASTSPMVVWVHYSLTKYGCVVDTIMSVEGFIADDFVAHKYDAKEMAREFVAVLRESNISSNAMQIIRAVLHMDSRDNVTERLLHEYAANSHHDNCATGLLAHMTKCVRIYNGIKGSYPFLVDERANDLMVISIALHDIGKIYEMRDGTYQCTSYLTHRALGFEHILLYRSMIVEIYDEEFFYMIASVILQHHGEYGEVPKTVYALLVHEIDNLEAKLTSLNELICTEHTTSDSAGTKIKFEGTYLNIMS